MPAPAPRIDDVTAHRLEALGQTIRDHRKRQKVSASAAAEAAGMSRVTLHRIERGEPSVSMGAYLGAIEAIGLRLALRDPEAPPSPAEKPTLPETVRLADYPALRRLAWQLRGVDTLSPAEALNLYERNWRHVDAEQLLPAERTLIEALAQQLGGGRLLV